MTCPGATTKVNEALFAVLAAKTAPEIRMPAIMDPDLLPNMGRMTHR